MCWSGGVGPSSILEATTITCVYAKLQALLSFRRIRQRPWTSFAGRDFFFFNFFANSCGRKVRAAHTHAHLHWDAAWKRYEKKSIFWFFLHTNLIGSNVFTRVDGINRRWISRCKHFFVGCFTIWIVSLDRLVDSFSIYRSRSALRKYFFFFVCLFYCISVAKRPCVSLNCAYDYYAFCDCFTSLSLFGHKVEWNRQHCGNHVAHAKIELANTRVRWKDFFNHPIEDCCSNRNTMALRTKIKKKS